MDGNTATLLDLVAKGARDAGAEVKFYTLFKMKFMACQSCFSCRINPDCAINDEVSAALQEVKDADAVVIGSPIYMMQMTGPVKNLYDRLFPLTDDKWQPRFGTKKLVTVYTQGFDDPTLFESYFEYTAAIFPWLGFDLVENIVCAGANDPETADQDAPLKIRAYEAGKALAARR
jgi:multimeric flavodoxin WrbA